MSSNSHIVIAKRGRVILLISAMVLFVNGCATPALLEAVDTRSKVAISSKDITEEELQEKGIPYTKFDGYYMVDKTIWRRARDYAVLGAALPFALVADGTIGAGVVGVFVVYCYAQGASTDPNKGKR